MKQSYDSELLSAITQLKLFNIHLFVISPGPTIVPGTQKALMKMCVYMHECVFTLHDCVCHKHIRCLCIFPYISADDYVNMYVYTYACMDAYIQF